jgi:hypothetical protein
MRDSSTTAQHSTPETFNLNEKHAVKHHVMADHTPGRLSAKTTAVPVTAYTLPVHPEEGGWLCSVRDPDCSARTIAVELLDAVRSIREQLVRERAPRVVRMAELLAAMDIPWKALPAHCSMLWASSPSTCALNKALERTLVMVPLCPPNDGDCYSVPHVVAPAVFRAFLGFRIKRGRVQSKVEQKLLRSLIADGKLH